VTTIEISRLVSVSGHFTVSLAFAGSSQLLAARLVNPHIEIRNKPQNHLGLQPQKIPFALCSLTSRLEFIEGT
jgi:hypothetical protein